MSQKAIKKTKMLLLVLFGGCMIQRLIILRILVLYRIVNIIRFNTSDMMQNHHNPTV